MVGQARGAVQGDLSLRRVEDPAGRGGTPTLAERYRAGVRRRWVGMNAMNTATVTRLVTGLVDGWLQLWNGDLDRAREIVTPAFRVHAAMMDGGDGSAVSGPDSLAGWFGQTRAALAELTFAVVVGPIVPDDLAEHWVNSDIHVLLAQLKVAAPA